MSSFFNERFGEIDLNNKPKYFVFWSKQKRIFGQKTFLIRATFFLFFENNNKSFRPFIAGLIF